MKHGQIATKELAEFVRERAAVEETYSKSMTKLSKMASNSSQLGTFAPMWDVFRVSSDKLALCHLELMRKMNDLIREINKYGDEQIKVHRKTKEEVTGTLEAVQNLQAMSGQLQKTKENYHGKCLELERLRREGAPQKELEKAESKSKKAGESFRACVEKYNGVGGDFEQKMNESAGKFQCIEEAHLRQMKLLIKSYSHSIEDTHVQVGQVHEEFKQNVENIGIENLIQKFAEQKGTGKERPALAGFEEYNSSSIPEGIKKIRNKAFRLPGLGKREKEPDSTDSAVTDAPNSPEVDEEGFVIRADINQNDILPWKETNFYSSDSDFDDDEPKKFNIRIRPMASGGRGNPGAAEHELKATVGALTLPPQRGVCFLKSTLTGARSEGEGDSAAQRGCVCVMKGKLSSTVLASETLFGPPLESAFKPHNFPDPSFSSDSSSPENVEDSGLDSPSHQPMGLSPEPCTWAAWPATSQNKEAGGGGDPFLAAVCDPSPGYAPQEDAGGVQSSSGGPKESRGDPVSISFSSDAKTPNSSQAIIPKERGGPPLDSPEDPFSITMIGSPTHQSSLAGKPMVTTSSSRPAKKELVRWNSVQNPFTEAMAGGWESSRRQRSSEGEVWRNGLPLTRHTGPQEDLCFSTLGPTSLADKEQVCYSSSRQASRSTGTPPTSRRDNTEVLVVAPPRPSRAKRAPGGRLSGCERSRSVCSSPLPGPSPPLTSKLSGTPTKHCFPPSSQSLSLSLVHSLCLSPSCSLSRSGLSRGPSPISLSTQEAWPVAAAITEYINAYFKGGEHNRCLVKITGDLTMSFPAGITRIFTANPNAPVLSFRLVNIARVDHFLPNQKLLYSDPSQSDPDTRDFWFNMQALNLHLQREAELNPQASYYNVGLLKYQVSSQDPGCAPLLLSAECQSSGTVTRVSLDYHCCPATATASQLSSVQVVLPLEDSATDVQCQPPGVWNAEERRLLWKLPNISPTADSKGSGTLCASWQCREVPRGPPPSMGVQFVGSGASLSGLDIELVGSRYRMSLVKKRFATGTLCRETYTLTNSLSIPQSTERLFFKKGEKYSYLEPCT
ncbi:FCHO1 protein, partial [Amia calva]|nr:FCHO1 protein [Amia calva]